MAAKHFVSFKDKLVVDDVLEHPSAIATSISVKIAADSRISYVVFTACLKKFPPLNVVPFYLGKQVRLFQGVNICRHRRRVGLTARRFVERSYDFVDRGLIGDVVCQICTESLENIALGDSPAAPTRRARQDIARDNRLIETSGVVATRFTSRLVMGQKRHTTIRYVLLKHGI